MNNILSSCLIILLATSCGEVSGERGEKSDTWGNEELVLATLYNYYAAEYMALSYQAWNIAGERLEQMATIKPNCSDLAVIVDIDETILDNSPFQAKSVESGQAYPAYWDDWCKLAVAKPVPGALEFLTLADSLGFKIFYISNRKMDPLYEATFKNLTDIGFPQVNLESMMLREAQSEDNPDPSDKEARRKKIELSGYNIVLLAGDNLGDFFIDEIDGLARSRKVKLQREEFGKRFIVLPNAMYGNWPASIGIDGSEQAYRELLQEMTEPFQKK